jgi:hypothetical protein
MHSDVSRLEQAWLRAETLADEARVKATEADRKLQTVKKKQAAGDELTILLSSVENARAAHAAAEQMACDAFERLWQAKGQDAPGQNAPRSQPQEQMNA